VTDQTFSSIFLIGYVLETSAGSYTLEALLGSGLTAEVYQAISETGELVAVKVMQPSDSVFARRAFMSEAFTLAHMRHFEEKARETWPDAQSVAPAFYVANEQSEHPYIVMGLMDGEKIPDLLEQAHQLREDEVLRLAIQLLRTLVIVHTDLQKTFIDLKFENLWWHRQNQRLKITDWGTLEEAYPGSVQRDLLRVGIYFYRMMTGHTILENQGVLNNQPDDYAEWGNLSWGLQQLLKRVLHRNPSNRPNEVAPVLEIIQELSGFWKKEPESLLEEARTKLQEVQAFPENNWKSRASCYRQALAQLDIIRLKLTKDTAERLRLAEEARQGVEDTDYESRGKALYEGGSYGKAYTLFNQGAQLYMTSRLRWWAWLAQAGVEAGAETFEGAVIRETGQSIKTLAEKALLLMDGGDFELASKLFIQTVEVLDLKGLCALRDESRIFVLQNQKELSEGEGHYSEAARYWETAQKLWLSTPKHEEWEHVVGDFLSEIERLRHRASTTEAANGHIRKAQGGKDIDTILFHWSEALRLDPGNQDTFLQLKAHSRHLADKKPQWAARALRLGALAPETPEFARFWHVPERIQHVLQKGPALQGRGIPTDEAVFARIGQLPLLEKDIVRGLLEQELKAAIDAEAIPRAEFILSQLEKIAPSDFDIERDQIDAVRSEIASRWVNEATDLLGVDTPEAIHQTLLALPQFQLIDFIQKRKSVLELARLALAQAEKVVPEGKGASLGIPELQERIQILEKQWEQRRMPSKGYIDDLRQQINVITGHLEKTRSTFENLRTLDLSGGTLEDLQLTHGQLLFQGIENCLTLLALIPDDEKTQKQLETFQAEYDRLSQPSWKVLIEVAQKRLQPMEEAYQRAQIAFEEGKPEEASRLLQAVENTAAANFAGFASLKFQIAQALALRQWETSFAKKLESGAFDESLYGRIQKYLPLGLPPVYLCDSPAHRYLSKVAIDLTQQVSNYDDPVRNISDFGELIRHIVWAFSLLKKIQAYGEDQLTAVTTDWDATEFLEVVWPIRAQSERLKSYLKVQPVLQNPVNQSCAIYGPLSHFAYRLGNPAGAQDMLARADQAGVSVPERETLEAAITREREFSTWQADNKATLAKNAFDQSIMGSVLSYLHKDFPGVYWQGSQILNHLSMVREGLVDAIVKHKGWRKNSSVVLIQLRQLITVNGLLRWAQHAAQDQVPDFVETWNAEKFLRGVSRYPEANKIAGILDALPINIDSNTQAQGITQEIFDKIGSEKSARSESEDIQTKGSRSRLFWILGIIAFVILVFACIGGVVWFNNWRQVNKMGMVMFELQTYTPTSTTTFTPTFTPTQTFTPTSTLTITPTPTLSPTPIPPSAYLTDIKDISPPIPGPGVVAYVLDERISVVAEPPFSDRQTWYTSEAVAAVIEEQTGATVEIENPYFSTRNPGSATWMMDTHIPTGWYEIFVADTRLSSGGFLDYNISLNNQEIKPRFGIPRVEFGTTQGAPPQTHDQWHSIGIYRFDEAGLVKVSTTWEARDITNPVAIERVTIAQLPESITEILEAGQDKLPLADTHIFFLDDLATRIEPPEGWQPVSGVLAWGDQFQKIANPEKKFTVTWEIPIHIEPGTFQVRAWIPENQNTAELTYSVLANGEPAQQVPESSTVVVQSNWSNDWLYLGQWDIGSQNGEPVLLAVQMASGAGDIGEILIDVIAFIRLP